MIKKKLSYIIASGLGTGYSPVFPGTCGTLLGIPFFYFFSQNNLVFSGIIVLLFFLGIYVSNVVLKYSEDKDPSFVVIDEVVGLMTACLFVDFTWINMAIIFVLFRFFDISKVLFVKRAEKLPGAWGIMLDDVLAGVWANLVFRLILFLIRQD